MCVKLSHGDLNPNPCPPIPTSTYTCEVTIAPMVIKWLIKKSKEYIFVFWVLLNVLKQSRKE